MAIRFSPDGTAVRVVGADGTVSHWDAETMKLARTVRPTKVGRVLGFSPRGKYILCGEHVAGKDGKNPRKSTVWTVDAVTGRTVGQAKLFVSRRRYPKGRFRSCRAPNFPLLRWANETRVIVPGDAGGQILDVLSGNMMAAPGLVVDRWCDDVTEDGRTLYQFRSDKEYTQSLTVRRVDLATGEAASMGDLSFTSYTGTWRLLVSGAKYFCVADGDLHLFDRETRKPVLTRKLHRAQMNDLTFSSDGRRFAFVDHGRNPRRWIARPDGRAWEGTVRIHDTATGWTLWALPARTADADIEFSPEGRRLLVDNHDGTLELWHLPEAP